MGGEGEGRAMGRRVTFIVGLECFDDSSTVGWDCAE